MKALKVLIVLRLFKENSNKDNKLSVSNIIELLEKENIKASRNTVKEYINILMEAGYDIVESKGRSNISYYYLKSEFSLEELRIVLDGIYSNKFITREYKTSIKNKLIRNSSIAERKKIGNMIRTDTVDTGIIDVMDNLSVINSSIDEKRTISFNRMTRDYTKNIISRGEVNNFVGKEIYYHNDRYYLIGFNNSGELRHYRIDRLFNINKGEVHSNNEKIDMENYSLKNFDMFSAEKIVLVEFKVKKPLIHSMIETFGTEVIIHKCYEDQEWFTVVAQVGINKGLIRWILKQGRDLEVIFPEKLRVLVKKELEEVIKYYK
ncbi:MAG: helix-turn-helix transcriptional regulator [Clostridiaceae bacterium]